MKILVTGATGFIGNKLCRALSTHNHDVRALIMRGEDYSHIKDYITEAVEGDITTPSSLDGAAEGIDIVYHLAARVLDYGSYADFYDSILTGTRNMLEASADKAGRFIFVSSFCACGTGMHLRDMKETDECRKTGIYYGDAKLEAEQLVKSFAHRFKNGFVIARPANVTGPGSVWVSELGGIIRDKLFSYFDGGRYNACLVHIDNLVEGLVLCLKEEASGQTYFFRDDWDITWKEYLDDLAALFGRQIRLSLPFRLAWTLGYITETFSRPFNKRPVITRHAVGLMGRDNKVSNSKAKTELGWKTQITHEEAMGEINKWVKENML